MSDLKQAIDELRASPHYKELATYEPPFNPFEIIGVRDKELRHSKMLAWLLRDEANKEFRQKFVAKMVEIATGKELEITFPPPDGSKDCRFEKVCVKTEHPCGSGEDGRIDVFTEFETLKLVIGIEAKIWAGEQDDQVERYQEFLSREYSNSDYERVIVFLTPGGCPSKTESSDSDVPVLEMSWSDIACMIREMRSESGNANSFRMQFSQHLDRNFSVNKEQRIVHELLSQGNNLESINKITSKMKTLYDKKAIEGEIDPVIKDNVEMVQKIIDNRSSLQTSLECKFWRKLGEQLRKQLQLQDKELEFQLYQSDGSTKVIENERLEEYIRWREGGSLGLTFRISGNSLDVDHEVVCRITYAPNSYLYYGFVLCKKDDISDIRNRVEIDDENHKEYLDLYSELKGEILEHGPDEDGKHGWLGWNERAKVDIYFANKPALFDTLVKIKNKERRKEVVGKLVKEICKVIETIQST